MNVGRANMITGEFFTTRLSDVYTESSGLELCRIFCWERLAFADTRILV